ncbi:hypothetical protein [Xanthobacter agilis]
MLVRLLLRLLLVPLGYFAAVLAGAVVIVVGQWRIGTLFDDLPPDDVALGMVIAVISTVTFLMLLLSLMWLVASVGILFSEAFAVRSWLFHAANGAVSAFVANQLFAKDAGALEVGDGFYILAAGLAGGLAYWVVAGSTAGFFKPVLLSPAERAARRRRPAPDMPQPDPPQPDPPRPDPPPPGAA